MAFCVQHVYAVFDRDCLAEPEAEHALLVEIENCLQQIESKAKTLLGSNLVYEYSDELMVPFFTCELEPQLAAAAQSKN